MAPCKANFGAIEPVGYPDQYSENDHFPVIDVDTKIKRIE